MGLLGRMTRAAGRAASREVKKSVRRTARKAASENESEVLVAGTNQEPDAIEAWTSNHHIRLVMTPSGNVGLVAEDERTLKNQGFVLVGKEALETLDFLLQHLDEIKRRQSQVASK